MVVKEEVAVIEKNVCRYSFTSLQIAPLETVMSHTSFSNSYQKGISVLSPAMTCLCEPLRMCTETAFEVTWERKVGRCVPRVLSYCCDIPGAKDKYLLFDVKLEDVTLV